MLIWPRLGPSAQDAVYIQGIKLEKVQMSEVKLMVLDQVLFQEKFIF